MARSTKMNSITSPELLRQVNPKNTELLSDFLDYLRSLQRSETTIAGYENDIQIAWVWCLRNNENKFFVDWTKRQVVKYQNWLLNENQNSPARVKRLKASLSSLANFIENILDDEFPNFRNIIKKVESPVNQPVREKTVFTDEQIDTLLNTLTEAKNTIRPVRWRLRSAPVAENQNYYDSKFLIFPMTAVYAAGLYIKQPPLKPKVQA